MLGKPEQGLLASVVRPEWNGKLRSHRGRRWVRVRVRTGAPSTPFWAMAASGSSQNMQWTSSVNASPFAIGGSVLYAGGSDGDEVYAFDAGGSAGCSVSVCNPLWSAPGTDAIVADGTLYVSTTTSSGGGEIVGYGLS